MSAGLAGDPLSPHGAAAIVNSTKNGCGVPVRRRCCIIDIETAPDRFAVVLAQRARGAPPGSPLHEVVNASLVTFTLNTDYSMRGYATRRQERPGSATVARDGNKRVAVGKDREERHPVRIGRMLETQGTSIPVSASKQGDDLRDGAIAKTGIDGGAEIQFHSSSAVSLRASEQNGLTSLPVPEYSRHVDEPGCLSVERPAGNKESGKLLCTLLPLEATARFEAEIGTHVALMAGLH